MEKLVEQINSITQRFGWEFPQNTTLAIANKWQKDLDKIKELKAKILSLECDNNELQEEANYFRNENLIAETEKKNLAEIFDAEEFLNTKDIYHHPRITDINGKESYEVAELMAEFANKYYGR